MTVASLINLAYRPDSAQGIEGAPEWINTSRFEIVASTGADQTREALAVQVPALVRSMLEDRFKFRGHVEPRQRRVYALVLARSDGRLGSQLRRTPLDCETLIRERRAATQPNQPQTAPPGCDRSGFGSGSYKGEGVVMNSVRGAIASAVDRPVIDQTGLAGRFDVQLEWAPANQSGDVPASDRASIFTAIQEQLGLKLESREEPLNVVVVEHVEPPLPD